MAAYYDIRKRKIPNRLIMAGWLFGVIFCFRQGGCYQLLSGFGIAAAVLAAGFPLFCMRMIGAGDIKLFSVIGFMQEWHDLGRIFMVFLMLAGAAALWKLIRKRLVAERFLYFFRYLAGWAYRTGYYEKSRDGTACTILLAPEIAGAYFLVLAAERLGML